jgi:hypothetical protein
MRRRSFLKGAGVVTVVVVGGGVWWAYDQGVFSVGEGPAYEPWKDWRKDSNDGSLALVRAAILAASPHNTQPWLFKVTNSSIELYIDTQRNVGALDPYLREEHIGMGCALENLMLAAAANGYSATVTLIPGKLGADSRRAQTGTPGARGSGHGYARKASYTMRSRGGIRIAVLTFRRSRSRPNSSTLCAAWLATIQT